MLVCRSVDVDYNGVQVLFGVDFDVDEGDVIALLGTNGAGKSTLLKAIAGIQEASGGAIVFDGRDTTHVPPNEVARKGVMLMPGGKGVFPTLSVTEYPPFLLARLINSLDHVTEGRVGWNCVTSSNDGAAQNYGHAQQPPHDERLRSCR